MGLEVADYEFCIQLDNTSSMNKNNIVLWWLAVQVAARNIGSASLNFLRTGHSHEDIDQMFGEIAKWIVRRLRIAHSVDDVISSLRDFFKQYTRLYEVLKFVTRMDWIRDWKSWVLLLEKKFVGIAGMSAPHVFEFLCRAGNRLNAVANAIRYKLNSLWKHGTQHMKTERHGYSINADCNIIVPGVSGNHVCVLSSPNAWVDSLIWGPHTPAPHYGNNLSSWTFGSCQACAGARCHLHSIQKPGAMISQHKAFHPAPHNISGAPCNA
jgi:hypothetical protein